jgi:hypothetical protein
MDVGMIEHRARPGVEDGETPETGADVARIGGQALEEIVITRHGRPAGILIGFASDEDWFEYRLEHHPEFLRRIEEARVALRAGQGIPLRDLR